MVSAISLIHRSFIVIINVTALWLVILVFFQNPKGKINKNYLWASVLIFIWINFSYLARFIGSDNKAVSLQCLRIAWLATPFFAISIHFLVLNLLNRNRLDVYIYPLLTNVIVIAGIITGLIAGFTPFIFNDISFEGQDVIINYESGMFGYISFILIFFITTLYIIIKGYKAADALIKRKIQYFLIGLGGFYIANTIFNIILPFTGIVKYYYIGDYSSVFLLAFFAYGIFTKELFGIKTIFVQVFVGIITILLSLEVFILDEEIIFRLIKLLGLVLFIYFGYLLIKSVTREIEQRQEIERLSNAKSEFISIASHQLRTPLTAIKGYISMALEGSFGKIPEKAQRPIKNVYDSNERLIKLVNDLLSFSRLESGKIEITKESVDVTDLISKVVNIFKVETDKKGLSLKWEKPSKALPQVMLDSSKITDAISNLINNAIKYTPKGGITIKSKIEDLKLKITIADTGVGMRKEEMAKLFQSFSRGATGSRLYTEGAGLGLYIAKKYVEMNDGTLVVFSAGPGKGTTFTIELPVNNKK